MELFLASTLLLGFLILVFFRRKQQLNLPPGSTGWPFIGETLEFAMAGRRGEPKRFILDRMSRYSASCFKTSLLAEKVAVMCGPQGNKFLFSNENKLVVTWWPSSIRRILLSSPTSTSSTIRNDNQRYSRVIAVFAQFMKPKTFDGFVGIMDSVAIRHFEDLWDNRDQILVAPLAKKYTFSVGCKLLLSMEDPSEIARLSETFENITSAQMSLPINLPGTQLNRGIKCAKLFKKRVKEIIKQRKIDLANGKATPTQDMLSIYLTTQFEGDNGEQKAFMNDDEISESIMGVNIAAYEGVSSVITFTIKYLAELPHVYDRVYQEQMEIHKSKGENEALRWADIQKMKYSWNVACEVMRLVPPAPGSFREALQDFTYDGFLIPKGWKLYWTVNSTNYDPTYFPDPEKFDPSRFEGSEPAQYTFVPFGGGPRMCQGKEFAKLYTLVFIHHVVKRYKWEKLVVDEKIIVNPYPTPVKGLPICILPHKG